MRNDYAEFGKPDSAKPPRRSLLRVDAFQAEVDMVVAKQAAEAPIINDEEQETSKPKKKKRKVTTGRSRRKSNTKSL